jgi:hypothetical protein
MLESGRDSISPLGAAAVGAGAVAAAAGCACARSTSSATMRPSGPVPRICARSTPRSRAMRRASGEALIRPFAEPSLDAWGAASARAAGSASCFGFGASAVASAPLSLGACAATSRRCRR